jgi:hypothetical protein
LPVRFVVEEADQFRDLVLSVVGHGNKHASGSQ